MRQKNLSQPICGGTVRAGLDHRSCFWFFTQRKLAVEPVGNVEKSRCLSARLFQAIVEIHAFPGFPQSRHFPSGSAFVTFSTHKFCGRPENKRTPLSFHSRCLSMK